MLLTVCLASSVHSKWVKEIWSVGLSEVVSSRDWRELAVGFSDVVKREDTGQGNIKT